jgi:hypothetical protein
MLVIPECRLRTAISDRLHDADQEIFLDGEVGCFVGKSPFGVIIIMITYPVYSRLMLLKHIERNGAYTEINQYKPRIDVRLWPT